MTNTNFLYSNFIGDNGRLFTNGEENSQFLILGVVLAVIWSILFGTFAYYFYNFRKVDAHDKIYGRPMLWTTLGLSAVILVDWILELVFFLQAGSVFDNDGDAAFAALVALSVIGFTALVAVILMMWFFLPYYGIAMDDNKILFMGEAIPYTKITKIVRDEQNGSIYVNYKVGRRTHKKQKFASGSVFAAFIVANADITNLSISDEDEQAYFKTLLNFDKKAEAKKDKEINEKIKEKSKKED